jgi:hypothetical protein
MSKVTEILEDVARIDSIESTANACATSDSPTFTGTVTAPTIDTATLTNSSYNQATDAILGSGTHTFDYSAGDAQQLEITGDTVTIAFSNFPTGKVVTMVIDAVNWGAWTPVLPAGMLYAGGAKPIFTAAGTDRLMVIKDKDEVYSLFIVGQDIGVAV